MGVTINIYLFPISIDTVCLIFIALHDLRVPRNICAMRSGLTYSSCLSEPND